MATVLKQEQPSNYGYQLSRLQRAELFNLIDSRSFKEGEFLLSSGKMSNVFFDLKPTMMTAQGAELSAKSFLYFVQMLKVDSVSGLEMGAVPIIGAMAAVSSIFGTDLHTTFVRKKPKGHGTNVRLEGFSESETARDRSFLVIDDVATTGGSILNAIEAVREAGGVVEHAACLVDRQEGGTELLADTGVELHSVFRASDFLDR